MQTVDVDHLKPLYVCGCFVCAALACLVEVKARRGHQIPQTLAYTQL